MSFKPERQSRDEAGNSTRVYPSPASDGTQTCRVSLIIDMGVQSREDAEDVYNEADADHQKALAERGAYLKVPEWGNNKGKNCIFTPRKPTPSVAVFVDLTDEPVSYGDFGMKHYRHMLNHSFKGDVIPIPFVASPPKGDSKLWTFDQKSMLSKLAYATDQKQIVSEGESNMDIEQLLGKPCLIDIEITKSSKGDKTYTNVKHKSLSKLMKNMVAPELITPAKLVTFKNATVEDVKFIRKDVRAKIISAHNFAGSQMEKAFIAAGFVTAGECEAEPAPRQEAPMVPNDGEDAPF